MGQEPLFGLPQVTAVETTESASQGARSGITSSVAEPQGQTLEANAASGAVSISDSLGRQVLDTLQSLQHQFETKLQYDAAKDRQIDRLHEQLQEARQGLDQRILRPIFMELISLYDDLFKYREALQAQGPQDLVAVVARNLESFQIKIEEMLRRAGVEIFTVTEQTFRGDRQRSLVTHETTNPALDKQVAIRLRPGFMYDGKVLRPEWVETYSFITGSSRTTESVG